MFKSKSERWSGDWQIFGDLFPAYFYWWKCTIFSLSVTEIKADSVEGRKQSLTMSLQCCHSIYCLTAAAVWLFSFGNIFGKFICSDTTIYSFHSVFFSEMYTNKGSLIFWYLDSFIISLLCDFFLSVKMCFLISVAQDIIYWKPPQ